MRPALRVGAELSGDIGSPDTLGMDAKIDHHHRLSDDGITGLIDQAADCFVTAPFVRPNACNSTKNPTTS